jgi:hypothetical protein
MSLAMRTATGVSWLITVGGCGNASVECEEMPSKIPTGSPIRTRRITSAIRILPIAVRIITRIAGSS